MRSRFKFGLMGLVLLVGCNSASLSGTVPVSGKVIYKGAPVEGAIVTFVPEGAGRPATATTTAGGAFSLRTLDASGAMPGTYKVTVDKVDYGAGGASSMEAAASGSADEGKATRMLPAKYADAALTPLSLEITSGGKKDVELALVD